MNLRERLAFKAAGIQCCECGYKFSFEVPEHRGYRAYIDPEFTDDGYLIEAHQRIFCSSRCEDNWVEKAGGLSE